MELSAALFLSRFEKALSKKDRKAPARENRAARYIWDLSDIVVKSVVCDLEKARKKSLKPPSPKPPPLKFGSLPKQSRNDKERGMPMWTVSHNWQAGPHIKTPEGWVPYRPAHHNKMKSAHADTMKRASGISEGIKALRSKQPGRDDYDKREEWLGEVDAFIKQNREFLEQNHVGTEELDNILAGNADAEDYGESFDEAELADNLLGDVLSQIEEMVEAEGVHGQVISVAGDQYRAFGGHWQASAWVRKNGQEFIKKLTTEESDAVAAYGGGTGRGMLAEDINAALRSGNLKKLRPEDRAEIGRLDRAISKGVLKENILAYRGLDVSKLLGEAGSLRDLVGKRIEDDGFVSVSASHQVAKRFADRSYGKPALVKVLLPSGTRAAFADLAKVKYQHEAELILPRGSSFTVKESPPSHIGGKPEIFLEYSGPSEKRKREVLEEHGQQTLFGQGKEKEDRYKHIHALAKKHFGTTTNPKEAGYVLPDGAMLDLSGRHYATGYKEGKPIKDDYLANRRDVDHRELPEGMSELVGEEVAEQSDGMKESGSSTMVGFMGTGAARVDFNSGLVSIVKKPSDAQLRAIAQSIRRTGLEDVQVEVVDPRTGYSKYDAVGNRANLGSVLAEAVRNAE